MVLQSSGRAPAWNQCHRVALFWGSQQEPTLTRGCVPVYPALFSKGPRVSLMLRAGLYMRKPPHTCVCLHISFPCDQVSMYIEKKLSKLSCHLVVTTCEKFYVLKLRKNPSHSLRKPVFSTWPFLLFCGRLPLLSLVGHQMSLWSAF